MQDFSLSGTGNGDGRCTDFSEKAVFIRTIYSDGRWMRGK